MHPFQQTDKLKVGHALILCGQCNYKTVVSKLHPTEATALRTAKQLKVFHKSRDKRQARVSNLVLGAL